MNDIAQSQLTDALARMNEALRILDEAGAPGDIGGHLDHAIARLDERLGLKRPVPDFVKDDCSGRVKDGILEGEGIGGPTCAGDIASV